MCLSVLLRYSCNPKRLVVHNSVSRCPARKYCGTCVLDDFSSQEAGEADLLKYKPLVGQLLFANTDPPSAYCEGLLHGAADCAADCAVECVIADSNAGSTTDCAADGAAGSAADCC